MSASHFPILDFLKGNATLERDLFGWDPLWTLCGGPLDLCYKQIQSILFGPRVDGGESKGISGAGAV